MKVRVNKDNDELFCTYDKSRIEIGEKYAIVEEETYAGIIEKPYKLENVPEEVDEEPWISPQQDFSQNEDL